MPKGEFADEETFNTSSYGLVIFRRMKRDAAVVLRTVSRASKVVELLVTMVAGIQDFKSPVVSAFQVMSVAAGLFGMLMAR